VRRPNLRRALVLLLGVCLLVGATLPAMVVAANQRSLSTILWALLVLVLMLSSFEFFHLAFRPNGDEGRLFSRGVRGFVLGLGHVSLAAGLVLSTFTIQHASDPICGGGLGAGFPVSFLCDASGDSPISGWGRITWTDIPNPIGAPIDLLFFAALIWLISVVATRIVNQMRSRIALRR
jgi:hypothetical protein